MPIIIKRDTRRGRLKSNDYKEFRLFNNKALLGNLSYYRPSEEVNKETLRTKDFGSVYKEYVYNSDKTPGYLSTTIPDVYRHNLKLSDVRQGLKDLAKKFPQASYVQVYRSTPPVVERGLQDAIERAKSFELIDNGHELTPKIVDQIVKPRSKSLMLQRFLRNESKGLTEFKKFNLDRYRK